MNQSVFRLIGSHLTARSSNAPCLLEVGRLGSSRRWRSSCCPAGVARRKFGFSMVEVALAVLILGMGVLTVVGLMSGSLQMGKNGEDDLQTAMFANDVLEGIRAAASVQTNLTSSLDQLIISYLSGKPLGPVAPTMWNTSLPTQNRTVTPGNHMAAADAFTYASSPTNIDATFRYNLTISAPVIGATPQSFKDRIAAVQLDVMSGKYGQTVTQTFYTEVLQSFR